LIIEASILLALSAGTGAAQTASTLPEPAGVLPEPRFVLRGIDFVSRTAGDGSDRKNGVRLVTSTGLVGAGWISAGVGARRWLGGDTAMVDANVALSWRLYKAANLHFEAPSIARGRLSAEVDARWQDLTQVTFYGEGPHSLAADRSAYGLTYGDVTAASALHPRPQLSIGGALGWMRSSVNRPAGGLGRSDPAVQDVFPDQPALLSGRQPDFIHTEISVAVDTRDFRSHPAHGGFYYLGLLSFTDQKDGRFSTDRFEAEAVHFVPVH
jgi:hypothetical protein